MTDSRLILEKKIYLKKKKKRKKGWLGTWPEGRAKVIVVLFQEIKGAGLAGIIDPYLWKAKKAFPIRVCGVKSFGHVGKQFG